MCTCKDKKDLSDQKTAPSPLSLKETIDATPHRLFRREGGSFFSDLPRTVPRETSMVMDNSGKATLRQKLSAGVSEPVQPAITMEQYNRTDPNYTEPTTNTTDALATKL